MLNELYDEYEKKFKQEILLPTFLELDEQEQIKILKLCLKNNQRLFENKYFNDNYIEEIES